ncbi:MAG: hypothetical protein KGO02_11620 [Alphaproteobacteria bacterium]|nr:hypothetical protein [Alphaproteobacteria bacterium]
MSIVRTDTGPFGAGNPGAVRFRRYTEFVAGLTAPQRAYLVERFRDDEAELQEAIVQVACGLSTLNTLHDATLQSLQYLQALEGH